MHGSVRQWVASRVGVLDLAGRSVLEVGSLDVNGGVRDLFTGPYVGVDAREGPGVDKVADAQWLPFAEASFQVVVSTEMLEHCERPWQAVDEMCRVLVDGGVLLLTCRGYDERGCWEVHDHPADFWRFSAGSLEIMCRGAGFSEVEVTADKEGPGWFVQAR